MRKSLLALSLSVALLTPVTPFAAARAQTLKTDAPAAPKTAQSAVIAKDYGKLPISFEANQGQTDKSVKFLARGQGYGLFLTGQEAVLTLHAPQPAKGHKGVRGSDRIEQHQSGKSDVVRMQLRGANAAAAPAGVDALPGTANYFIGNDPSKWKTGVPTYSKVRFSAVYPGVDLVYYGNQSQLEYDFVVAPGADPKAIRLHFDGARKLALTANGDLSVAASNGQIAFHKPVVYQVKDGQRQAVEGRFTLLASHNVGFRLGIYDRVLPLVIDPVLVYSTYLGGSVGISGAHGGDQGLAIAADSSGNAYVAGVTGSNDFPVTAGAFQQNNPAAVPYTTPFVSKFDLTGTHLLFSTYLGGSGYGASNDEATGIAVDGTGDVFVVGFTGSGDFPVTAGAFQTTNAATANSTSNAFITKLNPSGSALLYSTFLGGSGSTSYTGDVAQAIAVDSSGHAFVAGYTWSADFPTSPGAFQRTNRGIANNGGSAFIAELNTNGSGLVYSTFLGGSSGADSASALTLDSQDDVYVTGTGYSTDFPITPGAYQTTSKSAGEAVSAFVTKLNPTGTGLLYSTYLGGSGSDYFGDYAYAIAVDGSGDAFIAGFTGSPDFPVTAGAFQANSKASGDDASNAFVSKLNPTGTALIYSTYLGGTTSSYQDDIATGLAVDANGNAYVTGAANSTNFPVTSGAIQTTNKAAAINAQNAFISELNASGSELVYSTYLGGSGGYGTADSGNALALDSSGGVYVTGYAASTDFPVTTGAYQTTNRGNVNASVNAFVAKLDLSAFNSSTATTAALAVNSNPQVVGQVVSFTASVAGVSNSTIPTGTVTFNVGGSPAATVTLDGTGSASYSTSALAPGTYAVQAVYSGDSNFSSSTSNTVSEVITGTSSSTPTITSVSAFLPEQSQTVTITGSGFGTQPAFSGTSFYMGIWDDTGGNWSAGYGYDGVTATVSSWTDTQIVITGFGGYYGYGGYYQYNNGDSLTLNIWNPATSRDGSSSEVGVSPSTCIIIVGGGPTTCSAVASGVPTITWATPAAITQGTPLSATQLDATASVPGTFVYTPGAGAVPAAGTQTLSVTFTPTDIVHWTSATATVTLVVNPVTAGLTAQYSGSPVTIPSVNVGSVSASPISLTFTMNTAGTLGSTLVVTQGATGLDFTDAGTGTCAPATTYSAGATCTIQVNFAPNYPGPRYGAAELFDSSGNLIANVYLQGTGVAPLVNFPSGTQSTLTTSTLQSPRALAADGNGNVYIADTINGRILKETLAAGGYTESSVLAPGGYVVSYGIAVDGAGSVYVSDTFNGRVLKETPAPGGGYTQSVVPTSALYDPYGVAVDGSGNVYIADNGNNRVLMETLSAGAYTESTIGSGFNGPAAVAVDGNGVVYIADGGNFRVVKETPVSGGYHQNNVATEGLTGDGEIQPTGIAVDAIGDVYISDQRYGVILKESPVLENGAYEASEISGSGLNQPGGVAIDGSGNLYIADTLNNRVVIEDLVDPPSLTFPTPTEAGTTDSVDGWEVVTLVNIGNAPLAVSSVNSPSNFPVLSNFSPCQNVPTTVGIGGLCYLRVTFNPQTSGNLTGTVRITDNTLNAASPLYATQSFSVSGTGGGNPFGHLDSALDNVTTSSQVGQSDSVVVRGWAADYIDGAPLSNVTVYIDGTSVGAPTLGIARKDVAAAKGPAYLDSGFQLSYSAAALSLGSHAVTAIAIDSGGRSTTFGPVDITVAATAGPAPPTPPFGHIDLAVDSVTGSSTVGQSDSVAVKGWAADVIDGAPLSNVTVYIDGDILGTPTLGIARPDVAAAEGAAYLKSGYLMSFSAAGLALGSHAVTVTAIDSGGRSTTFGPVAYTVAAAAGAPPPFGHIDSAVDSVTGSSTVGQSNSVVVKGWVADAADGAPLSNVTVSIDGTSVGTPTMGIARSDVSAAEGAAYLHSGYELNYSAAGLSIGSHTVTVTAIDSLGLSKTFGPLAFTVAATAGAAPPAPPFGHLDSAVDSVTGSTSVSAGGYVRIVGWVADAVDGAPVSNVTVYIDGSSVGQPAPGQARPDVAAALGAAYYNSGYRFAAPVVALDVGSHSVTVTAIDSGGRSTTFGPLEFTVLP